MPPGPPWTALHVHAAARPAVARGLGTSVDTRLARCRHWCVREPAVQSERSLGALPPIRPERAAQLMVLPPTLQRAHVGGLEVLPRQQVGAEHLLDEKHVAEPDDQHQRDIAHGRDVRPVRDAVHTGRQRHAHEGLSAIINWRVVEGHGEEEHDEVDERGSPNDEADEELVCSPSAWRQPSIDTYRERSTPPGSCWRARRPGRPS